MKISCSFRHLLWDRFFLLPRMKDVLGAINVSVNFLFIFLSVSFIIIIIIIIIEIII